MVYYVQYFCRRQSLKWQGKGQYTDLETAKGWALILSSANGTARVLGADGKEYFRA